MSADKKDSAYTAMLAFCRQLDEKWLKDRATGRVPVLETPLTAVESPLAVTTHHQNVAAYALSLRKALINLDSACGVDPMQFQIEQKPAKKE